MIKQKTICRKITLSGTGLHSGNTVSMKILPSAADTGIRFRRTDIKPAVDIQLRADLVHDTLLATSLINENGIRVSTVEHFLSAVSSLGIDNLLIELDAPELPIMDGSAKVFVEHFLQAGFAEQHADKKFLLIKETVSVKDGNKWALLHPNPKFTIDFTVEFDHPVISADTRELSIEISDKSYINEIAGARTFGFVRDVEKLQQNGLGLGASLDNAVGLDEYTVLNPEGLRFSNELVRHKALDAVGDLFVTGHNIIGAYHAFKSGHGLNNKLMLELLAATEAWELVSVPEMDQNDEYSSRLSQVSLCHEMLKVTV
ncbi:UDP-3-O-acyl-N-acetylglucosamine deacetylase [Enterobacter hormaechei]|uniref:UDP-3-O-acyl-N-acetylglucosamine deacetylase n=1 Tax=Enterobacter ludwigii TaxID=299767 RepID=A0AAX3LIY6_9ENTR|nr:MULTISPECIES: UDP-3-O-acyl-N-acetylglucosamine deacetylase [Enterobacteriaceae]EKS6729940.1 UDP-3-O-acyl-N-acetylglucosamine deacetylase [Enterobacter mori]EES0030202.1 UDP-3-O-acyl-N-acetylglucosamine deacetylase [Escherichia coli]MBX8911120.1 UDP-3-O-acyl-N-acetylglucosamine deacetylase [Enterobacter ludwigii]MCD9354836.1 UDP-3-O-acyl-N-acetylglucosamine deacetylase [Klebsiella pneumoniae]MCD9375866.1 UDP-3-O-acyl-N-acetylglucosamine deacetylase [Klebsiella pneumoniae]